MRKIRIKHKTGYKWAYVDDEDYPRLSKYSWYLRDRNNGNLYAFRSTKLNKETRTYSMHREVLGIHENNYREKDMAVDHINFNGLDNRKENLRICNGSQSAQHRRRVAKKYRGVRKSGSSYKVQIGFNKKRIYLGSFRSELIAAFVYDCVAKCLHGEFASINGIKSNQVERIEND